jgi:hypothetical protein
VAPFTTQPTAAPNLSGTFNAQIHIPGNAMRQQQGKKYMGTLLFVQVSNSPDLATSLQG